MSKKTSKRIRAIIFLIALVCIGFAVMITKVDNSSNQQPPAPVEIPLNLNNNS